MRDRYGGVRDSLPVRLNESAANRVKNLIAGHCTGRTDGAEMHCIGVRRQKILEIEYEITFWIEADPLFTRDIKASHALQAVDQWLDHIQHDIRGRVSQQTKAHSLVGSVPFPGPGE